MQKKRVFTVESIETDADVSYTKYPHLAPNGHPARAHLDNMVYTR